MSKSILIIDTPSSCVICPLSFYNDVYKEHQCRGREYYRTIQDYKEQGKYIGSDDKRPTWCPLSPLPEPKDRTYTGTGKTALDLIIECAHDEGYNKCLQDLNGGDL